MITMRDIAVRAGVSRSTVSFVLNDKHDAMGVNENTRRRVLQVADELGYRRNALARSIVTGKFPVFGFLVWGSMLEFEVAARVMNGAMDEAEVHNYTVQVMRLFRENDEEVIRRCVEMRPTGVMGIYAPTEILVHLRQEMSRFHIPVMVLDSTIGLPGMSSIVSDDILGCHQAIEHLVSLGHRRIAFIGGSPETVAGSMRIQGYTRAMEEHGLPVLPGYLENGYWEAASVEQATRRLFQETEVPPTAVFCADDKTALVACRVIRQLGWRIPEQVSVIGFADLSMSFYSDPPLTTVSQPFHEIGRQAVRRLLTLAQEGEPPLTDAGGSPYQERLPTTLIVRQSTAPVAG
jgi:DNA-binding LacI/PurR family transcriptional regulator